MKLDTYCRLVSVEDKSECFIEFIIGIMKVQRICRSFPLTSYFHALQISDLQEAILTAT